MAYDIGSGDAVFTTSFTFFVTAKVEDAVKRVKSKSKLVARGVIPVNLFGPAPDFYAINAVVKEQRLFVFEDTVRGFSGQYKV